MDSDYKGFFAQDDLGDNMGEDLGAAVGRDTAWEYFNAGADAHVDEEVLDEIDFSELRGEHFGSTLNKLNRAYHTKNRQKIRQGERTAPLTKGFGVTSSARLIGKNSSPRNVNKVIVPDNQKIIVEGVDRFILDKSNNCEGHKNIGYYNCKKLKELVISMSNESTVDFNLELFNPSMPLDYLLSTSGNLNNRVVVAGGLNTGANNNSIVSYTDVLFNMLANPIHVVNAKFAYSSAATSLTARQIAQPLMFKNKSISGEIKVAPLNTQLQVDIYQYQSDVLFFDFESSLNQPFIPDGMDVIRYKVLAGCTVTFSFYYRQKSLKKFFYKEARTKKLF